MANYSSLNESDIKFILNEYNLNSIQFFKVLEGGLENSNYFLKSDNLFYVLTICEQKSYQNVLELSKLLDYLKYNDFYTSEIIRTKEGEPIFIWNKKPIMIKKFIEGKTVKNFSESILKLIGKQIAKLHIIKPPSYLPNQLNYGEEKFEILNKYSKKSDFQIWLNDKMEYVRPFMKKGLTKSFIHSDIFYDNIIVRNNNKSVVIMDFEESAFYFRVFDIGMAIIGVCRENDTIDANKVRSLLKGYSTIISLSENEKNSIKAFTVYAGTSMSFWRFHNFNHIKPEPLMFDHYIELKKLTDYIQDLSEEIFR